MATELDNLPDEEIPCGLNEVEISQWANDLKNEAAATVREFLKANDLQEWVWLSNYLDPSGPAFNNATASARIAWPKMAKYGFSIKGNQMVNKHRDRIRTWLDECGYSAEEIKFRTRRMFDAKKTMFFQKDGEVISSRTIEDNASILKALELASKHQGLLSTDKVDLGTIKIEVVNYLDRKDDTDPA